MLQQELKDSIEQLERDLRAVDHTRIGLVPCNTFSLVLMRNGGSTEQTEALMEQFGTKDRQMVRYDALLHSIRRLAAPTVSPELQISPLSSEPRARSTASHCTTSERGSPRTPSVERMIEQAKLRARPAPMDSRNTSHSSHAPSAAASLSASQAGRSDLISLRDVFRFVDTDRDGVVTLHAVWAALHRRGLDVPLLELEALADSLDLDTAESVAGDDDICSADGGVDRVLKAVDFCMLVSRMRSTFIERIRRASLWREKPVRPSESRPKAAQQQHSPQKEHSQFYPNSLSPPPSVHTSVAVSHLADRSTPRGPPSPLDVSVSPSPEHPPMPQLSSTTMHQAVPQTLPQVNSEVIPPVLGRRKQYEAEAEFLQRLEEEFQQRYGDLVAESPATVAYASPPLCSSQPSGERHAERELRESFQSPPSVQSDGGFPRGESEELEKSQPPVFLRRSREPMGTRTVSESGGFRLSRPTASSRAHQRAEKFVYRPATRAASAGSRSDKRPTQRSGSRERPKPAPAPAPAPRRMGRLPPPRHDTASLAGRRDDARVVSVSLVPAPAAKVPAGVPPRPPRPAEHQAEPLSQSRQSTFARIGKDTMAKLAGRCARLLSLCSSSDRAHDGRIGARDLGRALHTVAPHLTEGEINALVRAAHQEEGGKCKYLEFVGDLVAQENSVDLPLPILEDDEDVRSQQEHVRSKNPNVLRGMNNARVAEGMRRVKSGVIPAENVVRGRAKLNRLVREELLGACGGDYHQLRNALFAVDDIRTGYVEEKVMREALVRLFGGAKLPPWVLDRCVRMSRVPFVTELMARENPGTRAAPPTSQAEEDARRRVHSIPPALWQVLCDYRYLLEELRL